MHNVNISILTNLIWLYYLCSVVKYEKMYVQDIYLKAKFINVPICFYDEMKFVFQDKHATDLTVRQASYDLPSIQDGDLISNKNVNHCVDLDLQQDSDEDEDNNEGS